MSRRALVLLALVVAAPAAARAQTIHVQPAGDLSSLVGMPFDVPIVADWTGRPDKLGSFALTLRWDAAVLRFESGQPGSFGTLQVNTDSAAQGVLKLAGANPAGATGLITLGVGRFTPLAATTTIVTLELGDIYSSAPNFANLAGTTLAQNGLFCPARGRWGDPDGDGTVGSRDALIALSEAVGLDVSAFPEHGLSDVDADAAVKARDALVILSNAVGIDVSQFRVLRIAVGSCGSEVNTTYTVTPSGETLVANGALQLHFEFRATSGTAVRTLPDVFWRSSDPNVLLVTPDGRGVPVGPGSVVITGKSGQRDSAQAVMTVVSRRTRHFVDALAVSAVNRFGTLDYPFASLGEAGAIASEGDTIIVQPGRYSDAALFNVGVVILGQSGGAGVVLAGDANVYGAGIAFTGGSRAEVHNVSADRVGIAIAGIGVDTLVVDSLRYQEGAGFCGDYAVATTEIWRLEVRHSDLRGGGATTGCAGAIGVTGATRMILVEDVVATDFSQGGVLGSMVDSMIVRRSQLNDNGGYAIDAGAFGFGGSVEVPVPLSTALVVEDSRLLRNTQGGIRASDLRGGRLLHSTIESVETDGLYLQGSPDSTDHFRILSDTIRGHENYWLTSYDVDSLFVDSTTVLQTQDGYATGFRAAKFTNSIFDDIRNGEAVDLDGFLGAGVLVTNVTMRGDPACRRCANGFVFYGLPASVFGLTAVNLNHAVEQWYAPGTVSHSNITDANVGVYGYDNSGAASRSYVLATTMTNVTSGIDNTQGSVVADSLDMTGGVYGVHTQGSLFSASGVDSVRNSTIRNFDTGVEIDDSTAVIIGNTFINWTSWGLRTSGYGTGADSAIVLNNTFSCTPPSVPLLAYYGYGMSYRVAGNTFSGCGEGVNLSSTTFGSASVRNNVFMMPPNTTAPAIMIPSPLRADVVGNDIRGGGYGGGIYIYGYSYQPSSYARVDSNTIHGVQQRAIRFEYTDTVLARGNVIDTVGIAGGFANGATGITVFGATNGTARLVDNKIRHVAGQGILLDQAGSAIVFADSNAVSTIDSAGVRIANGQISMTGNNIRNNLRNGVEFSTSGGLNDLHGNVLQGNGLYAVANLIDAGVNADGNWWGAPAGPNTPGADSTFGPVSDAAPLAGPPAVPSLSAPLPLRTVALRPALGTSPQSTTRYVAPVVAKPAAVARVLPTSPRVSHQAGLPAPLAGVRERAEATRAERDAAQARRLTAARKGGSR